MREFVKVKCVSCGNTKKVYAGDIPKGEQPVCDLDLMPMLAVSAGVEKVKSK